MQTIVFNYQPSRLSREAETMALKIAYLLSSDVISAGSTPAEIHIRRIMNHRSLAGKVTLMANYYKDSEGAPKAFADIHRLLRQAAPVKHPTKEMIVARKTLEKLVLQNWDTMFDKIEDLVEKYGYRALRNMTDKVISSMPVGDDPELTDDVCTAVSELFRRIFPEEKEPGKPENDGKQAIFFLPPEFLSPAYNHPLILQPGAAEASLPAGSYLHHCFTFPHLHSLTASELYSVRSQLQSAAVSFRSGVNNWAAAYHHTTDTSACISLFLQSIIPLTATLQSTIDGNETLSLCRRLNAHNPVYEVWIGEIPVWNVWAFYRDMEAFSDETWQKLQGAKEEAAFKDRRWPVLALKATGNLPQTSGMDEEIQSIRKFLAID